MTAHQSTLAASPPSCSTSHTVRASTAGRASAVSGWATYGSARTTPPRPPSITHSQDGVKRRSSRALSDLATRRRRQRRRRRSWRRSVRCMPQDGSSAAARSGPCGAGRPRDMYQATPRPVASICVQASRLRRTLMRSYRQRRIRLPHRWSCRCDQSTIVGEPVAGRIGCTGIGVAIDVGAHVVFWPHVACAAAVVPVAIEQRARIQNVELTPHFVDGQDRSLPSDPLATDASGTSMPARRRYSGLSVAKARRFLSAQ